MTQLSNRRISSHLLLGCLLTGFSSQVSSAENQFDENLLVITGSRVDTKLSDLPNNLDRLTEETLSHVEAIHINESFSRIAGGWISRGNGQEHLTAIRSPVFTGPGSCSEFLMMEDNVPLRASGFCNVNQLFDANTEQAQSIEVVRGAQSALYGSNAIHGVVNVLSQSPDNERLNTKFEAGPHDFLRIKQSLVLIDSERVNSEQIDSELNGTQQALLLNVNLTHDGGFKADSGFNQQKLTLRHQTDFNGLAFDTLLSGSHLDQQTAGYLQQGKDAYKNREFIKTNQFPEAYRNAQSWRLQTNIQSDEDSGWSWRITPFARQNKMDFLMHFLPGEPIEKNGHQSLGIMLQAQKQEAQSRWVWGIETEYTQGYLEQFQVDETNSGVAFLNAVLPIGHHYDYEVNASALALYGQWQTKFRPAWSFTLGGRFDYSLFDYTNNLLTGNTRDDGSACGFGGCRYTRPADRKDTFDNFSFSAALGWQIDLQHFSYFKIDSAFRAPQTSELYRLQNGQLESEAKSQKADSLELGLRSDNKMTAWDLSFYWMEKDDVIFQNSDREFISGAQTRHRGIEASISHSLSNTWRLTSNLTYAKHQYLNNVDLQGSQTIAIKNNLIDTAPKTLGSMQLLWQPDDQVSSELEWVHIASYFTNAENTERYAGHDLLNLRITQQWSDRWSGFLRVLNLTDELYAERADFAFGENRYFVGEPRSFYIGVEYRVD